MGIKNRLTGVLVVLIGMSFMMNAFAESSDKAEGPAKWKEGRGGQHSAKIFEGLNLTVEQKERLKAGREKHQQEAVALRTEIKAKREQLAAALQKPELNMGDIHRIHDELKGMMSRVEDQRLASILEVRSVLTPEQFVEFSAKTRSLMEGRGKKRGEMKGKGERAEHPKSHGQVSGDDNPEGKR